MYQWGLGARLDGFADRVGVSDYDGHAQPTAGDIWLIRLTYAVMATESSCAKCGAPLGRGLHVAQVMSHAPSEWCVSVETRCRGWRRHHHSAKVTEASDDLLLGPFSP